MLDQILKKRKIRFVNVSTKKGIKVIPKKLRKQGLYNLNIDEIEDLIYWVEQEAKLLNSSQQVYLESIEDRKNGVKQDWELESEYTDTNEYIELPLKYAIQEIQHRSRIDKNLLRQSNNKLDELYKKEDELDKLYNIFSKYLEERKKRESLDIKFKIWDLYAEMYSERGIAKTLNISRYKVRKEVRGKKK